METYPQTTRYSLLPCTPTHVGVDSRINQLEHLGFEVDSLAARVLWMSLHGLDGPPTAQDH
jgi:hypothetical protein